VKRACMLAAVAVALIGSGCGGSEGQDGAAAPRAERPIQAPPEIAAAGELVICSDVNYPPLEFHDEAGRPVGSDIDVATEIARRFGVRLRVVDVPFDGIIGSLRRSRCDLIASAMNNTPERRTKVDFVDYLAVGQSLMVQRGNPEHVTGPQDLAGLLAAAQRGTTNAAFLEDASEALAARGDEPIDVRLFPTDPAAVEALRDGDVHAYFADSPVVAYQITRFSGDFEFAGDPINPLPVGLAIRKEDAALRVAAERAIDGMYRDGTMKAILSRWAMSDFALEQPLG
jgi:polar amino acid transport system substrate-binding protein